MLKTGIDIIYLPRFKKLLENPNFITKTFTENELINKRPQHLAGLFAVKEAYFKATNQKVKKWQEIEVLNTLDGKPYIKASAKIIKNTACSISHDQEYVIANVVILDQQ